MLNSHNRLLAAGSAVAAAGAIAVTGATAASAAPRVQPPASGNEHLQIKIGRAHV